VCGPWIWKANLIDFADATILSKGIVRPNGTTCGLYHHKDTPADWFKYWVIWTGQNQEGYMAGFVDLKRLTTNHADLGEKKYDGVIYVR
jgi:hypothetical protein